LTARELEIEMLRAGESTANISIDSKSSNAPGLDFKTGKGVIDAINGLKVSKTDLE
jgi:hypothetical protein